MSSSRNFAVLIGEQVHHSEVKKSLGSMQHVTLLAQSTTVPHYLANVNPRESLFGEVARIVPCGNLPQTLFHVAPDHYFTVLVIWAPFLPWSGDNVTRGTFGSFVYNQPLHHRWLTWSAAMSLPTLEPVPCGTTLLLFYNISQAFFVWWSGNDH